jgi:hypothetical protein
VSDKVGQFWNHAESFGFASPYYRLCRAAGIAYSRETRPVLWLRSKVPAESAKYARVVRLRADVWHSRQSPIDRLCREGSKRLIHSFVGNSHWRLA